MATQISQLPPAATPAAAAATDAADAALAAKRRQSRGRRVRILTIILGVSFVLGVASMSFVLLGSKKAAAPTLSPAAQAAKYLQDGLTAQAQGHTDQAISDYRQVLAIDPKNKYAIYNLGLNDQLAGRAQQAEQEYRQALAIDPNDPYALYNLAILRTGPAPQEAVDIYRHLLALNPSDAAGHLNLGFLLYAMGQKTDGTAELKLATGLDPTLTKRVPAAMLETSTPPAPAKR